MSVASTILTIGCRRTGRRAGPHLGTLLLAAGLVTAVPAPAAAEVTGTEVLAWGTNQYFQLGDGTDTPRPLPVRVLLPTGTTYTQISSGGAHSLAITSDGYVYGWGQNAFGQLGDGSDFVRTTPVLTFMPAGSAVAVSAAERHSVGLTSSGQVYAWGANEFGQLGNGMAEESQPWPVPAAMPAGTTVVAISAGGGHSLALTSTGQVYAWGINNAGQLGNGTTERSHVPVPVSLPAGTTVVAIAAGSAHSLALTSTGQLLAWGSNGGGRLGDGTTTQRTTPVPVSLPTGTSVTEIVAGSSHSLATTPTGQVLTWGSGRTVPVPVPLPAGTTVATVAAGSHSLGLTSTGQVLVWGTDDSSTPTVATLPVGVSVTAVAVGASFRVTLGSRLPAPVAGWGRNGSFELGNGSSLDYRAPGRVALPAGTTVGDVAAGYHHGLVATSTGGVLGWGANGNGQLGDGTTTSRGIPVPVSLPAGTVVTAVAAGLAHSLALTDTGQVYAWGRNGAGQLGDGTTVSRTSPVPVSLPTGVTITAIAAYNVHSLGLTTTGQVYAWGNNTYGQLGDGTTISRTTPVPVSLPAGTTATGLAAGGFHSLARTAAGPVLAWGYNSVGQLGDGSTTSRSTPVPVSLPGGTTVTSLAAGLLHSLAVTSAGQALAWGSNSVGQLGDGTITNRSTPVSVSLPAGTTVTAVAGGSVHSLAATSTGLVLGWGRNNYGQLGNIDIPVSSQVPVPTTQPLATPAVDVTAGEHHSLAR
ncbi:hypothetical protein R6Y94_34275 [Plantactinospora sp. KLBMP9567]|nr:hypothetical protein [Plantactinospora sp. KLBMP9567]MDW5328856.1 hypothetical protein [Plantactinospora sp. KLBMP9567]